MVQFRYKRKAVPVLLFGSWRDESRINEVEYMVLTKEMVQQDLDTLPKNYKTADVDRLIRNYVKKQADVTALRPYILSHQQYHRIYFYVALEQMEDPRQRMAFIHENLLFSDWWHTDQIIGFVADLEFETALSYAAEYIRSDDPFIRRWGYVLFISRLCKGRAQQLLPLMQNDEHYYVQMAESWLVAELAVHEPEAVYNWFWNNDLKYNINGKAVQKICDSFRITDQWKQEFKKLRRLLKMRK